MYFLKRQVTCPEHTYISLSSTVCTHTEKEKIWIYK